MIRELSKPYIMTDGNGKIYNIEMHKNYEEANRFARSIYGENASADEYRYLVAIGDIKIDGKFYNVLDDNTTVEAEHIPSEEENITTLQSEGVARDETLLDLDYRQTLLELGITDK